MIITCIASLLTLDGREKERCVGKLKNFQGFGFCDTKKGHEWVSQISNTRERKIRTSSATEGKTETISGN